MHQLELEAQAGHRDPQELLWSRGNEAADLLAKEALAWDSLADCHANDVTLHDSRQKRVLQCMAQLLALWPHHSELWGDVAKLRKRVVRDPVTALDTDTGPTQLTWDEHDKVGVLHVFPDEVATHSWQRTCAGKRFRCTQCCKLCKVPDADPVPGECVSFPNALAKVLERPRGHRIAGFSSPDGVTCFAHSVCGSTASGKARHILLACQGRPAEQAGCRVINRIAKGQHPERHKLLCKTWRVRL